MLLVVHFIKYLNVTISIMQSVSKILSKIMEQIIYIKVREKFI